jgi:hypothetical protein
LLKKLKEHYNETAHKRHSKIAGMKHIRGSHLFMLAFVAISLFAFAQPVYAVPLTLTIDNPHLTVRRPATGHIALNFTGTVSFGDDFDFEEAILDFDYNHSSSSGIPTELGSLDFSDADHGGSVSGILFTAVVSSSTIPGLYGFHFGGHDPAEFSIEGSNGQRFVTVPQTFSVLVTVPDAGNSALLLGTSILILVFLLRLSDRRPEAV